MSFGKLIIGVFFIGIVIVATNLGYTEYSEELNEEQETKNAASGVSGIDAHAQEKPSIDVSALKLRSDDITIGSSDAPIKIVEYASLSCPHCAKFHTQTLPVIKKSYIDNGEAVVVFRHFPLNAPAMRAAMIVDCAEKSKRAELTKHLFETQTVWAFNSGYLGHIAKAAESFGIDTTAAEACFSNTELENRILAVRQEGEKKLDIGGTPAIFVSGAAIKGAPTAEKIQAAINAALAAKTP